jgi:hypothetical protein
MNPRLPSWLATLEALALVVSPRLRLRQVEFIQLYLGCFILTFPILDLGSRTLFFPFKLYVGNYMLLFEVLIGLFQISYDTLLSHI